MKDNYTYAAIFDYSEEGYINIEFPEFENLFTSVDIDSDPILAAQEILALELKRLIDTNKTVPDEMFCPTSNNSNEKIVFVNVWLPYHNRQIKETYTKKTLTIPTWLDILAKQANLNFSSILVKALKKELNLKND